MNIVHIAPFAPNACGLYEAARDMIVADLKSGHNSFLIDAGIIYNNQHTPGAAGKIDDRGDTKIITASHEIAYIADAIIAHTGIPDHWISVCQAPLIWILHGRPTACFKPEQFKRGSSYTLLANIAKWPRTKAMVTFWPTHVEYWLPIIPDKLVCFDAPPIDEERFSPLGKKHDFGALRGKYNILFADSWREDIDIYEVVHGAIDAARKIKGLKFHFCAMEEPLGPWEFLIQELRSLGALGELCSRMPNMEERYRAADIVLTPHKIATRIIGESLSCGTPIVAANGCDFTFYTMNPDDPTDVSRALIDLIKELEKNPEYVKNSVKEQASFFSLKQYSQKMDELYKFVVGGKE